MIQRADPPLVLASASAARRAVLAAAGLAAEIAPSGVDEAAIKRAAMAEGVTPDDAALSLAAAKARSVAGRFPDALVLGADQLLVCDGAWFDKPADRAAAHAQLQALRGRDHVLVTAVVAWRDGRQVWQHVAQPRLTMRHFSDAFLDAYLAAEGDAVLASVGAYRLEGLGPHLFERIEGEHSAILGLPLLALLAFLRDQAILQA